MRMIAAMLIAATSLSAPLAAQENIMESPARFAGAILADAPDAAALTARCDEYVSEFERRFAALEAQQAPFTVDRTLKAYDDLQALGYSGGAEFYSFSQSMDTAEKREAGLACYARMTEIGTRVGLSRPIYDHLKAVNVDGADAATRYYLGRTLAEFERNGVAFDETRRAEIEALQDEITDIGNRFGANYAEARGIVKALPSELAGLPQDWIDAHPPGHDGLVEISTDTPDLQPVLTYAENGVLREKLLRVSLTRAFPENSELLGDLFTKRQQLADLLGRPDYATLLLEDRMLDTPGKVAAHMAELYQAAAPVAAADLSALRQTLARVSPGEELSIFNVAYVSQLAVKERFDLDPQEVRQYFMFDNVRQGIFDLTQSLFDVDIRPWDTPLWHPDVEAFSVYDGERLLGRFYLDSHPRPGKYQHANHIALRKGVTGESIPISVLTMNLPEGGYETGLMEHRQVETFLHEFGHLLHNILGGQQQWFGISGIANERDFTEAPSQMLEEWVYDYDTLARFARNEAGETVVEMTMNWHVSAKR